MAQVSFPLTNFQFADGNPVANGYLKVRLNIDGAANNTQLNTQFLKVSLDSSGNIIGSPVFWQNSSISPSTYYIYSVYSAQGQRVAGPNKIII